MLLLEMRSASAICLNFFVFFIFSVCKILFSEASVEAHFIWIYVENLIQLAKILDEKLLFQTNFSLPFSLDQFFF